MPEREELINTINRLDTVAKLELKRGDVLHVKLGMEEIGDGQGPWIPGLAEIEQALDQWNEVVPEGVQVLVTHIGQEVKIVEKTFDG